MDDVIDTIISCFYDMLCTDFESDSVKAAAQMVHAMQPSDNPTAESLRRRACDLLSESNWRCFSLTNKGLVRSANEEGWFFKVPGRAEEVFGVSSCVLRILKDAVMETTTSARDAWATLRIPKIPNPSRLIDQRRMCFDVYDVGRELMSTHLIDTDRAGKMESLELLKRVHGSVRGMALFFVSPSESNLTAESSSLDFFLYGYMACVSSMNLIMNAA